MQHVVEFGLQVLQWDLATNEVCSVRCQFCNYIGKEDTIGEKRKRGQIKTKKDWKPPFRTSNYRLHHEGQHSGTWATYQKLDYEAKKMFFDNKCKHKDTIDGHFGLSKKKHVIHYIDASIMDKIIGDMFFHPDTQDGISHTTAMKLFKPDDAGNMYTVTIKNLMQFHLIVCWLSRGVSFRQAADMLMDAKQVTENAELGSINDTGVSNYARVVCTINLGKLSAILNHDSAWAFSLANDSSTHQGKSYLNNHVRFHRDGVIYNVHVLAIPMYDHHTGENMFKLVSDVFDVVCPTWRTKLISMGSDGAASMVGEYQGIVTRVEQQVSHQLNFLIIGSSSALSYLVWPSST